MSTSAETVFLDGGRICAVLWRHYDGYPTSHGEELKDLLGTFRLENGPPTLRSPSAIAVLDFRRVANGMGCLAAQVVAHFKEGPGDFYLCPPNPFPHPASFRYTVYLAEGDSVQLRCEVPAWPAADTGPCASDEFTWRELYDGPAEEFDCEEAEDLACSDE